MNRLKQLSKKGWQFVGMTIILSCIPYFFIIREGDTGSDWTLFLMWMPGLAGIIMRLIYKEGLFSGLVWNPLKGPTLILLAAFIPFFIEILTIGISVGLGAAEFKEGFFTIEKGEIAIKGIALLLGASSQAWYIFLPNFLLSYFTGVLLYSTIFALGEELGWRGYLHKEWAQGHTLLPFLVIGGIWGWWHLPGILLGHNYPDYPLLGGFILMPLVTILFSVVFGVSFNQKRVIWIPVVFHGAVNISAEISSAGLLEASINRPVNDFIWTGLWGLTALAVWKNRQKSPALKSVNMIELE